MTTRHQPPTVISPKPNHAQLIDLTGRTFGQWTVLRRGDILQYRWGRSVRWVCICACSAATQVHGRNLQ
jgi:hypothetical protein